MSLCLCYYLGQLSVLLDIFMRPALGEVHRTACCSHVTVVIAATISYGLVLLLGEIAGIFGYVYGTALGETSGTVSHHG